MSPRRSSPGPASEARRRLDQNKDLPTVQGVVLVLALIYIGMNLLVDLSYALVDPRIRFE